MTDPFSIVAGVVGIVAATAHAIHAAVDLIDKIEGAPKAVYQIRAELNDTESVVRDLETILDRDGKNKIWTQLLGESKLSNALKNLKAVCESFVSALKEWTRHSPSCDKFSFQDSFVIAMQSRKISALSKQLNSCKQTVMMAMSSCALQGQVQNTQTTERIVELLTTQEREATGLFAAQRAVIESLNSKEQQLEVSKKQPEVADDINELGRVQEDIDNVHRASLVVGQFATVSEYVAKSSAAIRTNQDIGNVVIAELGFGAIGMSNVDEVSDVKQKIGDVSFGKKSTGFVGIHNNIDHNAVLANRWGSASNP
ncbi:hypothetical protein KCU71_g14589, partial [Aureobasidium melanogenum]